jgi:hypothetical protein
VLPNTGKASTSYKERRKVKRMEREVTIKGSVGKPGRGVGGWSLFEQNFIYIENLWCFLGRDYADDNDIQQEIAKHLNKKTAEKGEKRPRQRRNSWA